MTIVIWDSRRVGFLVEIGEGNNNEEEAFCKEPASQARAIEKGKRAWAVDAGLISNPQPCIQPT